jgi:hypothetical protein
MNFVNQALLKLVLLPKRLYISSGINTAQLQSILTAKLLMDDRRPAPLTQNQRRQKVKKDVKLATLTTMFVSTVMGCLFLLSFSLKTIVTARLTFYFSYFIFMLASTLISDFTSVLIDVRDNYIILPKPVSDRTMLMARLLHIFIHMCKLVLPMLLPGIIYMGIYYGIEGCLLLFVSGMLAVLFTIFLINAVYIFILRITTPEKFKTIISYIQIGFAVVVYASFQLLPRVVGEVENFDFHFSNSNWLILLPPYWFAAGWSVLYNLQGTILEYCAAACALLLPFVSLWIVIRFLAPSFNRKLSLISNTGSDAPVITPSANTTKKNNRTTFSTAVANLFTKPGAERMGFLFTWYMMARSRDFKMKIYPAIGYLFVYIAFVFFSSKTLSLHDLQEQTQTGRIIVVVALYFGSFLLSMAVAQLCYSEKYKAAWLYFITPVAVPGNIINGAVKAAITKFYFPFILVLTIPGLVFIGISFIPNLLLAMVNQLFICYFTVYMGYKELPFSRSQSLEVKTGSFMRNLFRMIIPLTIGIFHYFIYTSWPLLIIALLIAWAALWMITGSVKKLSWAEVKTTYTED